MQWPLLILGVVPFNLGTFRISAPVLVRFSARLNLLGEQFMAVDVLWLALAFGSCAVLIGSLAVCLI